MRWEAFAALALLLAAAPVAAAGYVHDDRDLNEALAETENQPGHPYHTWETLTVDLQRLVNENPDIARLHSAGESVLGLDLWVVEIADFGDEDRRPLDERETVWLDGGTHANEQLGMELAYEWVEFLLDGYGDDETATWIVENRHTYIMPLVNPDGNHLDSRTNARGVDMNRNYPVGWGALDENRPPVGPGSYPASEPEVQTVLEWWDETEPDYVNSFHSGIDLMLYPPGYEEAKPADQQVYRRICEEIGEPDPEFCGPIYSTIYPAAGGSIEPWRW
jgi:murein tripeptide amidase MpaA